MRPPVVSLAEPLSDHHFDRMGNVKQLTSSGQTVTDTYDTDAWGANGSSSGSTVNPFRFGGQFAYFTDGDSGFLPLGVRYLDTANGRFTQRDPVPGFRYDYRYVACRPTVQRDATGRQFEEWMPKPLPGMEEMTINRARAAMPVVRDYAERIGRQAGTEPEPLPTCEDIWRRCLKECDELCWWPDGNRSTWYRCRRQCWDAYERCTHRNVFELPDLTLDFQGWPAGWGQVPLPVAIGVPSLQCQEEESDQPLE